MPQLTTPPLPPEATQLFAQLLKAFTNSSQDQSTNNTTGTTSANSLGYYDSYYYQQHSDVGYLAAALICSSAAVVVAIFAFTKILDSYSVRQQKIWLKQQSQLNTPTSNTQRLLQQPGQQQTPTGKKKQHRPIPATTNRTHPLTVAV